MKTHPDARQAMCLRCQRVIGLDTEREKLIKQVAAHMAERHDFTSGTLIEGGDFQLEPAPYRCDLCGVVVEPPVWDYRSHVDVEWMSDDWLVCFACHELIADGRITPLFKRVVDLHLSIYPLKKTDVLGGAVPIVQKFLDGRYGTPVKEDGL